MRLPFRFIRPMMLVCVLSLFGRCVSTRGEEGRPPTLAVLDFRMEGDSQTPDNWAVGLADFMELGLQEAGAPILSRMSIPLVLQERRLHAGGLVREEDRIQDRLPWVRYLVGGSVALKEGAACTLHVSLVDAQSAVVVQSWDVTFETRSELIERVQALAPQVLEAAFKTGVVARPERRAFPGFTKIPESAYLFYRGLDHLLRERPGYAAEYFRLAANSDPQFLLALLWETRAYEALGLRDHAELVRKELMAQQAAQGVEVLTSRTDERERDKVVSALFVNRATDFDTALADRLRGCLRETDRVSLFAPEWINDLAAENDLKLSGEFSLSHGLDDRIWLQSDYIVVFQAERTPEGVSIRMNVVDVMTGASCGECRVPAAKLDDVCSSFRSAMRHEAKAGSQPAAHAAATNAPPALRFTGHFSTGEFSAALERYAAAPTDRRRLLHVYWVFPRERSADWAHSVLLMQTLAGLVDPAEKDAAYWVGFALMQIHKIEWQQAKLAGSNTVSVAERFAGFLKRYPDSLPAQVARYTIACEQAEAGDHAGAADAFAKLAEWAPAALKKEEVFQPVDVEPFDFINLDIYHYPCLPPNLGNGPRFAAHIFFRAAAENLAAGRTKEAGSYLEQLKQIEKGDWENGFVRVMTAHQYFGILLGLWSENPQESPPRLGWTISEPGPVMGSYMMYNGQQYKNLADAEHLVDSKLENPAGPSLTELEQRALDMGTPANDAIDCGYQYLERLHADLEQGKGAGHTVDPALRILDKLFLLASSDAERDKVREWGRAMADVCKNEDARHSLLLASRNFDAGKKIVFRDYHLNTERTLKEFLERAWQLKQTDGRPAEAEFCDSTLKDYEVFLARQMDEATAEGKSDRGNERISWKEFTAGCIAPVYGLGNHDWDGSLMSMYLVTAYVLEKQGEKEKALSVYERGEGRVDPSAYTLSLTYYHAKLLLKMGDAYKASELLKTVIEAPESKTWRRCFVADQPGMTSFYGPLYSEAIDLLEKARGKAETK